jgi:nitronate monooxygenase
MGVAISNWRLAHAVASEGQLGVVSGTGIDAVLTRRLQDGDHDGSVRRALAAFPLPKIAQEILEKYFVPGGIPAGQPYKSRPIMTMKPPKSLLDLIVVGNFVEVFLAKEGHNGVVGLNLLEKIQMPTIPSLLGAMMAGVDYVIMGAGIPKAIPGILERLSQGLTASLDVNVGPAPKDVEAQSPTISLDPAIFGITQLKRPKFLAVIASASLATLLAKKCNPPVDGFVIEGPTAGGHNAPPRGELRLNEAGEPIYGERDEVDLAALRALGLPFWLAGSYADRLKDALAEGAQGVQVGTAFAFCRDSGMDESLRRSVVSASQAGTLEILTDPKASPTGFPFKVVQLAETVSNQAVYEARHRICDLGYLRSTFYQEDGTIGYRCAAEPVDHYEQKGGCSAETEGKMCICNGLMASAGFASSRKGGDVEPSLVTAGDDVKNLARYIPDGETSYTAKDVISRILAS